MVRNNPVGNTEEIGYENHECEKNQGNGNADPQIVDEPCINENENGTDAPTGKNSAVGVRIKFYKSHTSPLIAR
jgi:hypothetical protein